MRCRVHPLFFALALILVLFGQALAFVWTFVALILHELGHAVVARARGYVVHEMVLLPFGALMNMDENFDRASSVVIGLAGPFVNLLVATAVVGLWWVFPASYPITQYFFFANITLALFNLLPAYPLDGSRVALGFCKNKLKAVKALQICGVIISLIFFALFVASAFYDINFSVGIISLFLFYGATSGAKEEMYISILDSASKNYQLGIAKKWVTIAETTPILRLYHHISSGTDTVFTVVDSSNKTVVELDERQLKEIAVKSKLSVSIGQAYKNCKH
ncbi:MAG: site-2 protease family protein [Clostridia bacterium]